MSLARLLFSLILLGIISAVAIVYFYILQRDVTTQNKEFLIAMSNFKENQTTLTNTILQNSLFTYHNQDKISENVNLLNNSYKALKNSKLLENDNYKTVAYKLDLLKQDLDKNLESLNQQRMFNAGIRNSLVFLSRHIETIKLKEHEDFEIYTKANKLLKRFNDTMLTLDLDYIKRDDYLLKPTQGKNEKFVNIFNLHSEYLLSNLPQFMLTTRYLINNNIFITFDEMNQSYEKIAIDDIRFLDIFASVLFSVFLLSIILVLIFAIKYFKENKKLLATTQSLEHSIAHDLLTGLLNRKSFTDNLSQLNNPHVLLVNIDSFKHVNDIYGNSTGNKVIQSLGQLLFDYFQDISHYAIYRTGGDEFAILFETIYEEKAIQIANDLHRHITEHKFMFNALEITLSVSIASNNIKPILENADLALKMIKKDLTKRVIAYKEELNLKINVRKNLQTIDIIKNAINEDRVIPYFQPIVNLKTLKVEKYEALVRIVLEDGKVLTPFHFLETAKKTSYYLQLSAIMVKKTMKIAKEYPQYRFSVNLSMIDILNNDLINSIFLILKKDIKTASRIDIELVESENIIDISLVKEFIDKVHAIGSNILIDDFGSGYSNFSYFANLDIDIVKIDGSIVKEQDNLKNLHMLKSIYNFSKGLGLISIAEFVETQEIVTKLQEIGVEYAQGYFFSPPVPKPLDYDDMSI